MRVYLTSYYPLCSTRKGKLAIKQHPELEPFIDGSCRREPDFQNQYPCITGLCRPGFAKKLNINDIVIYVTNKRGIGSRNVIAVLKVIEKFDDHEIAATWYRKNQMTIPNNLMVAETSPYPLEKTHQIIGWNSWIGGSQTLVNWDEEYKNRANLEGNKEVARCKTISDNLKRSMMLNDEDWKEISERALCTQNPPILNNEEVYKFKLKTNIKF